MLKFIEYNCIHAFGSLWAVLALAMRFAQNAKESKTNVFILLSFKPKKRMNSAE